MFYCTLNNGSQSFEREPSNSAAHTHKHKHTYKQQGVHSKMCQCMYERGTPNIVCMYGTTDYGFVNESLSMYKEKKKKYKFCDHW